MQRYAVTLTRIKAILQRVVDKVSSSNHQCGCQCIMLSYVGQVLSIGQTMLGHFYIVHCSMSLTARCIKICLIRPRGSLFKKLSAAGANLEQTMLTRGQHLVVGLYKSSGKVRNFHCILYSFRTNLSLKYSFP